MKVRGGQPEMDMILKQAGASVLDAALDEIMRPCKRVRWMPA